MVMRLELGRRADYAIRAAVDLARHVDAGSRRKAHLIADEMDIPPSFVPQVLAALVRAGIAESHSGRGGGYRLSSSPAEVSLLQVIQAATGELASETCVLRGGPCDGATMCAVHVPWLQAQQALLDALDGTTLEDLVVIDAGLRAGTFEPPVGFGRAGSAVATVR
jgi:Rrf2 family transcriptional regulator, iron-sulfur cluster assembly transcription factor